MLSAGDCDVLLRQGKGQAQVRGRHVVLPEVVWTADAMRASMPAEVP